jgi:hypothetical protein
MCQVVGIENIISSYFLTHKEDKVVNVATLNEYKRKLEDKFRKTKFVYVDNTRDAWLNAMNHNRDLFCIKSSPNGNTRVELVGNYEHLKQLEGYFNARLPFREDNDWKIYAQVLASPPKRQRKHKEE